MLFRLNDVLMSSPSISQSSNEVPCSESPRTDREVSQCIGDASEYPTEAEIDPANGVDLDWNAAAFSIGLDRLLHDQGGRDGVLVKTVIRAIQSSRGRVLSLFEPSLDAFFLLQGQGRCIASVFGNATRRQQHFTI